MSSATEELEALLASAEDTFQVDFVEVPIFDPETGESAGARRIRVRGANLFELARFFLRYPDIFLILQEITGNGDGTFRMPNLAKLAELVLKTPEAIGALNSVFVSKPFDKGAEAAFARMSNDANAPILEKGLFKSFDGDVQGFFDKRVDALRKATGWKRKKTTSTRTSEPSSTMEIPAS